MKRNSLFKPKFYALQSFEDHGGPIDHLISKKQAISVIKTRAVAARHNFYTCLKKINALKLQIMDHVPLF